MSTLGHFWCETATQIIVLMPFISPSLSEIFRHTAYIQLSQMFLAIIFFHLSEYLLASSIHGRPNVTAQSLLISKHYILAMVGSLLEYLIEITFFPSLKEYWWLSSVGLAMIVIGEIIRKMAILTAGRSFTHLIRIYREENHKLVTHGIYGFIRHPSYCGFLIWSVGTQVMLLNPVCVVAFAVIVWRFFAQRIPYEEYLLRQFFGAEYEQYARRVISGVPFVK
ncbi:protein-S-isoprenylcysteine O-methyltransferase [Dionaea muscipula]